MLPTLIFVLSVGRGRRRPRFGETEARVVGGGCASVEVVVRVGPLVRVGNKTLGLEAALIGGFVVLSTADGRKDFSGFLGIALSFSKPASLFFSSSLNCSG